MHRPSLSYLLAHPAALGISALRPWVLALVLAAPLFLLWRPHGSHRAAWLRCGAFVALILALGGVRLTTLLPSDRLTLIAAVDVSTSIDSAGREWMKRYLDEVVGALAPGDELGIVAFGDDISLVQPPGPPTRLAALPPSATRGGTALDRAVETAVALFPPDGTRRLLLVTDGNETGSDSRRQLPRLLETAVRVDAAVPPHEQKADVRIEKVVAPAVVAENHVIPLRVVAHNTGSLRSAVLTLQLDGETMESAAVELQPGPNTIELPAHLTGVGSHRLRARLEATDDAIAANNAREIGITVRGKTRLLLITPRRHSPLAVSLARKNVETEVRTPEQLPRTLDDLLTFHGVLLEDVTAAQLPVAGLRLIEEFVREHGGGLVVAGGAATYGDEGFTRTPLKQLLPVTLEPRRPRQGTREPLGLFIVIDRSNSMGYNSRLPTVRDGEKLRYAKEAALAVIRQLKDQDLVGLIAFDSQPHEISSLKPLRDNRATLESLIPRLVENGGTDFYDALVSARSQLAASRVNRRHIVLLTDGDTNRSALDEYRALIQEIGAAKISVTTIRIGDNTVNLKLLREISEGTGGEFHYAEDAQTLPDLMLRDATRALGSLAHGAEEFYPQAGRRSQMLRGIDEQSMPPLAGYAYARPKDGSEVLLQVSRLERRDPILAVWQYGLGRVAAYTASPSEDAEQWLGWEEFGKFWSQLVHWTARERAEGDYAIDARRHDGLVELSVQAFGPAADRAVLVARLHLSDTATREVSLVAQEPRRFTAQLADIPAGRFPLTIIRRQDAHQVTQHTALVSIPADEDEPLDEHRRAEPDLGLLTTLTEQTGGTLNPSAREIAERSAGTRRASFPLDAFLLPLAMLLFLGDVAVRRLNLERRSGT